MGANTAVVHGTDPAPRSASEALLSESAATLRVGLAATGWTVHQWWEACIRHGGQLTEKQLGRILCGGLQVDAIEHDLLADVFNRHLVATDQDSLVRRFAELDPTTHHPSRFGG